jgi:hypothetical protein
MSSEQRAASSEQRAASSEQRGSEAAACRSSLCIGVGIGIAYHRGG